ncbi:MAG TPA: hypothetical protein VGH28_34055 [Polyangiaceae bacterium]|jgi:hypothetical protein
MRITPLLAVAFALVAIDVRADETDAVARLEAAGGSVSWNYVPRGRSERFGHAEALALAPTIYVRDQATDFVHYKDMSNGRIRTSRLVDKRPGSTDVYLQVPVLHGMLTLWQVLRFGDVHRAADGTETMTGKLVRGNVHAAEMTFTIRPAGQGRSIVTVDMMLEPGFAAPQSMVDAELRDAARSAARALASHAEQKYVASLPPAQNGTAVAESH